MSFTETASLAMTGYISSHRDVVTIRASIEVSEIKGGILQSSRKWLAFLYGDHMFIDRKDDAYEFEDLKTLHQQANHWFEHNSASRLLVHRDTLIAHIELVSSTTFTKDIPVATDLALAGDLA